MQIVIALPAAADEMKRLEAPVCGVPLIARVVATALRCGGSRVLLLQPPGSSQSSLSFYSRHPAVESAQIQAWTVGWQFDPRNADDWRALAVWLDNQFLWLPCDYVADKAVLTKLLTAATNPSMAAARFSNGLEYMRHPRAFDQPMVLLKREILAGATEGFRVIAVDRSPGVSARPPATAQDIEAELVRRSGKVTDGIYSRFNRRLCWPAVRWLSHTRVTPNAVSFAGLAGGAVAALCFTQGTWLWDIAGAAWFFISGLFDEIDGMLARLTFRESAFGCWLETFVDYATYLLAFAGMTAGGYQPSGSVYLASGAALLLGCLLSFFTISLQRKLMASAQPTEYHQRYLKVLDRDAGSLVSKLTRNLQFLLRKGVLIHYVLLFAVLNQMRILFFLTVFGANAAWLVTMYLNRRLFVPNKDANQRLAAAKPMR